jgi:hypothetical protein
MANLSGIFIDPDSGIIGVAGAGVVVKIGLRPDEMRALADKLLSTADRLEEQAIAAVDGAIARARGTLQ